MRLFERLAEKTERYVLLTSYYASPLSILNSHLTTEYTMNYYGLSAWFDALTRDVFICSPNQRLVRFYQREYANYQSNKGCEAFAPLDCMALELWQNALWRKAQLLLPAYAAKGQAINPLQKKALWQQVLSRDDNLWAAGDVLDPALDADKLLKMWGVLEPDASHLTDEFELFMRWQDEYRTVLNEQKLYDSQDAYNFLLEAIEQKALNAQLPQRIVFTGFDQWPTPLKRLEQALVAAGVEVAHHQVLASQNPVAKRRQYANGKSEVFAAATWALEQSTRGKQVAVVVPDLGQRLTDIERVFQQVFEPNAQLPQGQFDESLYNVSAAEPLGQCPLIKTASQLIAWQGQALPVAELKALMLSPFVLDFGLWQERAQLMARLAGRTNRASLLQLKAEVAHQNQRWQEAQLSRAAVAESESNKESQGKEAAQKTAPLAVLHEMLEQVYQHLQVRPPKKALPSQWCVFFSERLRAWAWPGSRTLSSHEYQQHEHWQHALAEFALFDSVLGAVDFKRAQQLLTQSLKAPFHKQTPPANVQILGVLEAAGQLFDGIWWLGLDAHSWPEPLKPNPLLPAALQREHKMPRANATAELDYAAAITQRITASAEEVIVSHPAFNGEEPLVPSPLIEAFTAEDMAEPPVLHPWQCKEPKPLQLLQDDTATAIATPVELRGGVGVIKRQAACPFQAFAVHRLQATSIEPMEDGLNNRDRGNLVHDVLEHLWQHLQTQQNLLAQTPEALAALIAAATDEAIARLAKGRRLGERLLLLEAQRVQSRVDSWLALERLREPFTVKHQEETLPLELAGLKLRLRMDRVDCLADGKTLAVIDYKTGKTTLKSWQWPRIDEPQIPLYATALPDVGAAVFAQVNTQEMKYLGLTAMPHLFAELNDVADSKAGKGWPDTFADVLMQWQQELQAVAASFVAGHAAVAPKNVQSCMYCELHSLCRIAEHSAPQAGDGNAVNITELKGAAL